MIHPGTGAMIELKIIFIWEASEKIIFKKSYIQEKLYDLTILEHTELPDIPITRHSYQERLNEADGASFAGQTPSSTSRTIIV